MLVVRFGVDLAVVQLVPPFQESCTHILGAPVVPSARASRRTSIPATSVPRAR